jgi:DNA-binding IclR family transcriptional regulator
MTTALADAERQPDCPGGLQSVLAALDLLECFVQNEEFGVSELARKIGVAKSTAHRLLTTLCARGFAVRDEESGRYRLGLHLYELGHLAVTRSDVHQAALPILQDLHQRTGYTAHIGVPDGQDVLYLERIVGREHLDTWSTIKRRLPSVSTGSGKLLYAYSPRFSHGRMNVPLGGLTLEDASAVRGFRTVLKQILDQGYALSVDEQVRGLTSVAAPVLDHDRNARASLSLVGPTAKVLADVQNPARLVQLATKKLTKELCL